MSRPKRSKNPTSRPASGAAQGEGTNERTAGMGWDGMVLERIIDRDGDDREGSGGYGA